MMASFLLHHGYFVTAFLMLAVNSQTMVSLKFNVTEEDASESFSADIPIYARLHENYNPQTLKLLRFSFLPQHQSNAHTLFKVDKVSGKLQAAKKLDRDVICADKDVCTFKLDIAVTPAKYFQVIQVEIMLLDINDNTPVFPQGTSMSITIPESHPIGSSYIISPAQDSDAKENAIQKYELLSFNNIFDLQVTPVPHDDPEIKLVLKSNLDREKVNSYKVKIVAIDGGTPARSGFTVIDIEVSDINDNGPQFRNNTYKITVAENHPIRTPFLRVQAYDLDEGSNGVIIYNFTEQTLRHYGQMFTIDRLTGDISANQELDYETRKLYKLNVRAHDLGLVSMPGQTIVIINITDVNDNEPDIDINVLSGSDETYHRTAIVPETSKNGTFVALISVEDLDSNENGQFTCRINSELFKLEKVDDLDKVIQFKVITDTELDYEAVMEYNITIKCKDKSKTPKSSAIHIRVKVKDENDHKPNFNQQQYKATIFENVPIGEFVTQVNATDGDRKSSKCGELHYKIKGDSTNSFTVDEASGVVVTKSHIDYEKGSNLKFQVVVHDMGEPSYSATAWVTVMVIDQNDETPKFKKNSYSFGIFENQPVGTEVGTILAEDKDSGNFGKVSYSFDKQKSTNGLDSFEINSETGQITTTRILDRETTPFYYLVVKAKDHGYPPNFKTVTFTIFVVDGNDNAPIITSPLPGNSTVDVLSWLVIDDVITEVKVHDKDTGNNGKVSFSIKEESNKQLFKIHPITGEISAQKQITRAQNGQYQLVVTVQDRGFPVNTVSMNITININITGDPLAIAQIYESLTESNLTVIVCLVVGTVVIAALLLAAIVFIKRRDRKLLRNGTQSIAIEAQTDPSSDQQLTTDTKYSTLYKEEVTKEVRFSLEEELPTDSSFHQVNLQHVIFFTKLFIRKTNKHIFLSLF